MAVQRDRTNPRNHIEKLSPEQATEIVAKLSRLKRKRLLPWTTFELQRYIGDSNQAWKPNEDDLADVRENVESWLAESELELKIKELTLIRTAPHGRYERIVARITCE